MPNLRHLLEELEALSIEPTEVRLPGQLYDELLEQVEPVADEEQEQE